MKLKLLSILMLHFVLVAKIAFSEFNSSGQFNSFKAEMEKRKSTIIINGEKSNHKELRKINPKNIREVNFKTNPEGISKKGSKANAIIEVTLFNLDRPEPEIPDTLQVRVNGMRITDYENQPSPLLVFDSGVILDQNPNNIDTRDMKWIDFHLADAITKEYEEKAKAGIIEAKIIHPDYFFNPEVMPEFSGGDGAIRAFVNNNLLYPEEAIKDSLQGKVYVTFNITKTGKVENAQIARGIHPLLDKEAIRVVSLMPDWNPGSQWYLGKISPVKCSYNYTIPVNFKLPNIHNKP